MLNNDYIIEKLQIILPLYIDTYTDDVAEKKLNEQLSLYAMGAMNKLENEGVPNVFNADTKEAYDYILCISYQVAIDMDFDIDYELTISKYLTRVNTLRNAIQSTTNS